MSRIGKLPISIPANVTVTFANDVVSVKGPKGEMSQKIDPSIITKIEDNTITFEVDENSPVNYKQKSAFHGLYRSLVHNMVVGVSEESVIVFLTRATSSSSLSVTLTPSSSSFLLRLRWRLRVRETRILSSLSRLATSSCSVSSVPRFVLSASLSLTRARVYCSKVKLFAESLVSLLQLSNILNLRKS